MVQNKAPPPYFWTVQINVTYTIHWTVVHLDGPNLRKMDCPLDRCPFGRSVTVYLDRPIGYQQTVHLDGQLTYIWTFQLYVPESSKWTVHVHVFRWSKYTVSRRTFGGLYFVQMNNTGLYIWMRPNQRYRDIQMDAVQKDGSGTSE